MAGDYPVTYVYRDNAYPEADLEIRDKSYLESLALKPDTPVYSLSSETGYAGYRCAVRMDEAYDCVHIQETGETVIPDSEGLFFISSRVIGEEDMAFTIAAEREGFVSPYGETLILRAEEKPEDGGLLFPDSLTEIGEEAFRGTGIISVTVPERIQSIGDFAFADNPSLLFAELNGQELGQGVFDNCPLALFCIDEENAGMFFEEGKAFLVKHRD